jgi:broad specificity phosphatase PhoE
MFEEKVNLEIMVNELIVIRHGSRMDFENPEWHKQADRPHDPPLTKNGLQQAGETAGFLKGIDISHLFSSPFYRAVQTADAIAKKFNLKIKVEHGFSEWMNPQWFNQRPRILNQQQLSQEFETLDMNYQSYIYPEFPETPATNGLYKRVNYALEQIIDNYDGTIVIVGHGATIHEAGNALLGTAEKMSAGLCAVNFLKKQSGYWRVDYASNDHLKTKDIRFDERLN